MNERIRELAVQARQEFLELPTGYTPEQVGMYPQLMEKFAELIVQECLEQIDKIRDGCEADKEYQQALGADWAGLAVARHFGVK